jgi:hypothetical protein
MTQLVINVSGVDQQVGIITDKGAKVTFRLMERGRTKLPDGYQINPAWIALHPGALTVIDEKPPVSTTQETAKAEKPVVMPTVAVEAQTGGTK